MVVAAFLTMLVLLCVKDLNLYSEEENEDNQDDSVELEDVENRQQEPE